MSVASASHRGADAVLPLDTRVEGEGYPELTARWWQWAMAAPIEPYFDPDGRFCAMHQDGPVWFLAGTSGGDPVHRRCVVPSGKYLLLPVINRSLLGRRGMKRLANGTPHEILPADLHFHA
jgi:hypothetical protein